MVTLNPAQLGEMLKSEQKAKSTKIRASARGKTCFVCIPSICDGGGDTTVLAHLHGGGMGSKTLDIHAAYCCSACHDVIDGRIPSSLSKETLTRYHLEGVIRTQKELVREGLLSYV
jgi:hypothetical protein